MRIGIDIDDTITNTWEFFMPLLSKKYNVSIDKLKNGPPYYDAVKDIVTMAEYIDMVKKSEDLLLKIELKPNVIDVLTKLKQEGHTIIFITARCDEYNDPYELTKKYLEKYHVPYDKIIVRALEKGKVCKEEKINLFIDDSINNCQKVRQTGIDVLLMETNINKSNKEFIHMKDWNQVYDYINSRW